MDIRRYAVTGQLFWASSNDLGYQFDYAGDPRTVLIDLTAADVWAASTVASLDAVQGRYAARGKEARIIDLDGASLERLERLSGRVGAWARGRGPLTPPVHPVRHRATWVELGTMPRSARGSGRDGAR